MMDRKDVAPLEEVIAYVKNNEWQFKMLAPSSPVKINARMLYSVYYYLRGMEDILREQPTEGREHPELSSPAPGAGSAGLPQADERQD